MSKPKTAAWALRELKAIEELYDHGRCSVGLRDSLQEQVFKQLEQQMTNGGTPGKRMPKKKAQC